MLGVPPRQKRRAGPTSRNEGVHVVLDCGVTLALAYQSMYRSDISSMIGHFGLSAFQKFRLLVLTFSRASHCSSLTSCLPFTTSLHLYHRPIYQTVSHYQLSYPDMSTIRVERSSLCIATLLSTWINSVKPASDRIE